MSNISLLQDKEDGSDVRGKLNASIVESNKVSSKVDTSALSALEVEVAIKADQVDLDDTNIRVESLEENQFSGVIVFQTYALMEAQSAPEEDISYKVANDSTSSNNGYYSYNGATYDKDADLVNGVIELGNIDAASGGSVYDYFQANKGAGLIESGNTDSVDGGTIYKTTNPFNNGINGGWFEVILNWVSGYIDTSGLNVGTSTYERTEYIAVNEGEVYDISGSGSISVLIISAYSSEAQVGFISGSTINTIGTSTASTAFETNITIPSGVNYIRMCRNVNTPTDDIYMRLYDYAGLNAEVYGNEKEIELAAGYIDTLGNFTEEANYRVSNFIDVSEGEVYDVSVSGSSNVLVISAYSDSRQDDFISGSSLNTIGDAPIDEPREIQITIPSGVVAIRICKHPHVSSSDTWVRPENYREGLIQKVDDLKLNTVSVEVVSGVKPYFNSRRKPTFAFVWDDLNDTDNSIYEIFQEFGYLPTYALQTANLNSNNAQEYVSYYKNGCSILAHSINHPVMTGLDTISYVSAENEMANSKKAIEAYGIRVSGWVTPSSVLGIEFIDLMIKNFGYGFTALNDGNFDETVDPVKLNRYGLEANIDTDTHSWSVVEARIDLAITNNELLVFYGHEIPSTYLDDYGSSRITADDLRVLLTYLKDKSDQNLCQVLACDEAIYQYYKTYTTY